MSLGSSSMIEHIEELKAMISFQTRLLERLKNDATLAQSQVDTQLEVMDSINALISDNQKCSYTSPKSPFVKTLKGFAPASQESQKRAKSTFTTPILSPLSSQSKRMGEIRDKSEFCAALDAEKELDNFFFDHPIVLNYLLNLTAKNDSNTINSFVEQLALQKRTDYFTNFFRQLNETSQIFNTILSFVNTTSIAQLTELMETKLPALLNCARASFFHISGNKLILEKSVMSLVRRFTSGSIYDIHKKGTVETITSNSEGFNDTDKSLMMKNMCALVIPTHSTLLLLFDKTGGFKPYDFTIAEGISRFLVELIPSLQSKAISNPLLSSCINIIHQFNPAILADFFHCKAARVFRVSKNSFFYDTYSERTDKYPISKGIIGQCITKRRAIKMDKPEYSVLFDPFVDRMSTDVVTSSLLASPIFDETNEVRWAIALYSRQDLDYFSEMDENALKMICKSLNPIIRINSKAKRLKKDIKKKEQYIDYLFKLASIFSQHGDITDINLINMSVARSVGSYINATVELSLIDNFRNHVSGLINDFDEPIDSKSEYSACILANIDKVMENESEDQTTHLYVPLKSLEKDQNSGFIQIEVEEEALKKKQFFSVYSSISLFSVDSGNVDQMPISENENPAEESNISLASTRIKRNKSTVQLKLEKLASGKKIIYKPTTEHKWLLACNPLRNFIGPFISAGQYFLNDINASKFSSDLELLENETEIIYNCYEDLAAMIGAAPYGPSSFLAVPVASEEYQKATVELFMSLAKVCGYPDIPNYFHQHAIVLPAQAPLELNFDVFGERGDMLMSKIANLINVAGSEQILEINNHVLVCFLRQIRSLHSSSWNVCVDNAQYSYITCNSLKVGSQVEKMAMMLYLLIRGSDKIEQTGSLVQALECGTTPKVSSILLFCASAVDIDTSQNENWIQIAKLMNHFEESETYDIFSGKDDPLPMICMISTRSSIGRTEEIARKYLEQRFPPLDDNQENPMKNYLIEAEIRSMILPMLLEITSPTIRTDTIRNAFVNNIKAITGTTI